MFAKSRSTTLNRSKVTILRWWLGGGGVLWDAMYRLIMLVPVFSVVTTQNCMYLLNVAVFKLTNNLI